MYGRFVASIALVVVVLALGGPEASAATPIRWASAQGPGPDKVVEVVTIVDAGTIDVRDAGAVYRVRAIGVDVPLVTGVGECWSTESVEFARRTLEGKQVRLAVDPTQIATDQWGRAMRYIVLPDDRNYSIVAAEAGVAWAFVAGTIPGQFNAEIGAAEQKAKAGGVGLWAPPCNGRHHTSPPTPTSTADPPAPSTPTARRSSGAAAEPEPLAVPPLDLPAPPQGREVQGPTPMAPGVPGAPAATPPPPGPPPESHYTPPYKRTPKPHYTPPYKRPSTRHPAPTADTASSR